MVCLLILTNFFGVQYNIFQVRRRLLVLLLSQRGVFFCFIHIHAHIALQQHTFTPFAYTLCLSHHHSPTSSSQYGDREITIYETGCLYYGVYNRAINSTLFGGINTIKSALLSVYGTTIASTRLDCDDSHTSMAMIIVSKYKAH